MSQLSTQLAELQIGGRPPLAVRAGARHAQRAAPDRFRPAPPVQDREPPASTFTSDDRARFRPIGFLVQSLLATAPQLAPAEMHATTAGIADRLAAYHSRAATRISYSGPVMPIDLLA